MDEPGLRAGRRALGSDKYGFEEADLIPLIHSQLLVEVPLVRVSPPGKKVSTLGWMEKEICWWAQYYVYMNMSSTHHFSSTFSTVGKK